MSSFLSVHPSRPLYKVDASVDLGGSLNIPEFPFQAKLILISAVDPIGDTARVWSVEDDSIAAKYGGFA